MLVRSVCTSHACNFEDIRGNESHPCLQVVKKLAMPLVGKNMWERQPGLLVFTSSSVSTQMEGTPSVQPSKNTTRLLATSSHWIASARILMRQKNLVTRKIRDALQIYQRHSALNRDQGYNVAPVLLSLLSRHLSSCMTNHGCLHLKREAKLLPHRLLNSPVKFQFVSVM